MPKLKIVQLLQVVALLMLIIGCEKTVSIDVGQIQPRLVVNSILCKDSLIKVQLSKSRAMMDTSQSIERINKATIKIYEDEILKQTLTKGYSGLFTSTIKPKVGSGYRIEIDNAEFGHVEASSLIPPAPHLISATQTTELTPESDPQNIKFKIALKDDGPQPNYYYLRAILIKKGYQPGANPNVEMVCKLYSDDNIVEADDHTLKGVVFNNAAFVGSNYELIVYSPNSLNKNFNLWFELSSISPEYYKYLVSVIMQNNAGNNPFAEPVEIKSNIENGTGILGAQNKVYIKVVTF
ncbi:MAG: DUF4249 domain-containing protein [Bacteroidota bacterium]|nr:DUF4249 domain-containing protein [Bacteroidota bacterium]